MKVSGIQFQFDPKREPMKRILLDTLKIAGTPLDLNRKYTLATKQFLVDGKDGYDVFLQTTLLTDESVAEELHSIIKRFFGRVLFGLLFTV